MVLFWRMYVYTWKRYQDKRGKNYTVFSSPHPLPLFSCSDFHEPTLSWLNFYNYHNYRIITWLQLTQQGVLNQWNHEITDWDGMICCSQQHHWLFWWQRGRKCVKGRACLEGSALTHSTSPQPVPVSAQRWSQGPQSIFDALWPRTQGKAARLRK